MHVLNFQRNGPTRTLHRNHYVSLLFDLALVERPGQGDAGPLAARQVDAVRADLRGVASEKYVYIYIYIYIYIERERERFMCVICMCIYIYIYIHIHM